MGEDITSKKNTVQNNDGLASKPTDDDKDKTVDEPKNVDMGGGGTGAANDKSVKDKMTVASDFGYIADLTAYNTMVHYADAIALKINNLNLGKDNKILIVDSIDFCIGDAQFLQVENQIKIWKAELQNQKNYIVDIIDDVKDIIREISFLKELPKMVTTTTKEELLTLVTTKLAAGKRATKATFAGAEIPEALLELLSSKMTPLSTVKSVGEIVSATAEILGYFAIDYELKNRTVKLSDTALQALVVDRIRKDFNIYHLTLRLIKDSPIIKNFESLIQDLNDLIGKISQLKSEVIDKEPVEIQNLKEEIKKLEEKLNPPAEKPASSLNNIKLNGTEEELKAKKNTLYKYESLKNSANTIYTESETIVKAFSEFTKSLTTVAEGSSYSPLVNASIRDYVERGKISHLLYLTVTSSGGQTITSTGVFRRGMVDYMGGGVFTCILTESNGKIVASDTIFGASSVKVRLSFNDIPAFKIWKRSTDK